MATPEDRPSPSEVQWALDTHYRPTDNAGTQVCRMWGYKQREGTPIFRGPFIDEFDGFFAIGIEAAEDLAKLIGWVDPDTITLTPDEERDLELQRLRDEVAALEAKLDEVKGLVS